MRNRIPILASTCWSAIVVLVLSISVSVSGSLRAVVVDESRSLPLPGANVSISRSGGKVAASLTDENGVASFQHLDRGEHEVLVKMFGYKTARERVFVDETELEVHLELREYKFVSIIQLLANPDRFDGHPVRVSGFCALEPGGSSLYLDRDSWEHRIRLNSLRIHPRPGFSLPEEGDQRYVTVLGVYQKKSKVVHYVGAIDEVENVSVLPSRQDLGRSP